MRLMGRGGFGGGMWRGWIREKWRDREEDEGLERMFRGWRRGVEGWIGRFRSCRNVDSRKGWECQVLEGL